MIKIIITSIILFIFFVIILLSFNVKIEYFNSGSLEPVISGDYISDNIDSDNIYYMFRSGTSTFTIPSFITCDILIVGGGGSGRHTHGSGGGAGAVIYEQNITLNAGTYTISIGAGGICPNTVGLSQRGQDTIISYNGINIYLALGGGGGGGANFSVSNGGSGGGQSGIALTTNIPSGLYGNNGGSISHNIGIWSGGGGGGAGGVGNSASQTNGAGAGGIGKSISITGSSIFYGGGGGGGSTVNNKSAIGGNGGGGSGGSPNKTVENGVANTGGGGGGGYIIGGNGGSGVVIIRINKKINSYIDNSSDCPVNLMPSGVINQVPDTNMNISVVSNITKQNDNLYNQSFGNGNLTYTISFSKYFNDDYIPTNLFLRNNKVSAFAIGNYNNGIFNTNINTGLNNYTEKGEFIHIRLPSAIILKRFGFRADSSAVPRAPGSWVLYTGNRLLENTNVNKQLLVRNTVRLDNSGYCQKNQFTYYQDIQTNGISGNELLFIFPSLAGSGNVLSFMELLLFSG